MAKEKYNHIIIEADPDHFNYTSSRQRGNAKKIPYRNRFNHSEYLKKRLEKAWENIDNERAAYVTTKKGVYLEFKSEPGFDLITKSLDLRRQNIRLLNIRTEKNITIDPETNEEITLETTFATIFVPYEKRKVFLDRIEQFESEDTVYEKPKHDKLIRSIGDIQKAILKSFWLDDDNLIPGSLPTWCEVWLNCSEDSLYDFDILLSKLKIDTKSGYLVFPERIVKVINASREQLEMLIRESDYIAEFRLAKETAEFWINLSNKEQSEWVEDLLNRLKVADNINISVCILDTGINNGHPLISPVLTNEDCHTVLPEWGTDDHDKHGTLMAGTVTYRDLINILSSKSIIEINHCLESVKILPKPPEMNNPNIWGYITAQGISKAEIQAPKRIRTICMAVTASDTRDRGRPSSWSAEIDQLTSGAQDETKRLFIISAGNFKDEQLAKNYPDEQLTDSIHDPGQSWNAITVGAYTNLSQINDPSYKGCKPIANAGCLSPFTTTSLDWEDKWPIKPEIVMEGGNLAITPDGSVTQCEDLSILSTYYKPHESQFEHFNMTSAATALVANYSAHIQARYPEYWPETVRALLVHSATWPDTLKNQCLNSESKTDYKRLLKICGYGVPSLDNALYSASNSLTLISQKYLQPYNKIEGESRYKTKDMHLYELPWPKEVLLGLPDNIEVQMRITLSYFIEPGPGRIGWKDRYRYASHALRFDIKSPAESNEEFIKRINIAVRDDEEDIPETESATKYWTLGAKARNKGSIHSDIWNGTPQELADSNVIAVFPKIGWWRERHHLQKWNKITRYSLIITISTPEEEIDIYTPVAIKVGIMTPISIATTTEL